MRTNKGFFIDIGYLTEYINANHLTNRKLAEIIGVSESAVSRVLNRKNKVGGKMLLGILLRTNINVKKLIKCGEVHEASRS